MSWIYPLRSEESFDINHFFAMGLAPGEGVTIFLQTKFTYPIHRYAFSGVGSVYKGENHPYDEYTLATSTYTDAICMSLDGAYFLIPLQKEFQ